MTPPESPISPDLDAFVAESLDRRPIFEFVSEASRSLAAGARVLDAGSGEAPYRALFDHCEYVTGDWEQSIHEGGRAADVVAPLDELPLEDESFDAVLCTQVLEHLADPVRVLGELRRVLVSGGAIWITAPLVWELHEEPHDYYRYTSHGLRELLERAGFAEIEVRPLTGYFTTIAQLLRNGGSATRLGDGADGVGQPDRDPPAANDRAAARAARPHGPPPGPAAHLRRHGAPAGPGREADSRLMTGGHA